MNDRAFSRFIGNLILALGVIGTLFVASSELLAHPFHMCVGEMEWNAETQRWEVGLRVKPEDLIAAIHSDLGEKIDLDSETDAEVLQQYLSARFFMARHSDPDGLNEIVSDSEERATELKTLEDGDRLSSIHWIGLEEEKGWCWLYFELEPPAGEQSLVISHQLLLNTIDNQENSVLLKRDGQRLALQFNIKNRVAEIPPAFAG